jgi:CHAD domain-containing protein
MKKSERIGILDKRCHRLQKHKEQLLAGFAAEANHDFRVEVKKLRAFLRLLRFSQPQAEGLHLPRSFHQFYQAVGEVRSMQIQKKWVEEICKELACSVPAGYMEVLARKEKEAIRSVKDKAKEISLPAIHDHLVKAVHGSWHKKDAEAFVRKKREKLVTYLASVTLTDEVLHNVRKLLKNLLYVWPWIEVEMVQAFPSRYFTKEACLSLAGKLGNFQDSCTVIALFSPPFLAGLSPGELHRLAVIKERCVQKKEKEKAALIVTLLMLKNELVTSQNVPQTTQPAPMA